MSKLRRLAFAGAVVALAVGAPGQARGQATTDNRLLFLAAVGGVTPSLFTSFFAVPWRVHSVQSSHGSHPGDVAPFVTYSSPGGGLLNDQGNGSGKIIRAVDAFFVTFVSATPMLNGPSSTLGSLLSGSNGVPSLFAILTHSGHQTADGSSASTLADGQPPTLPDGSPGVRTIIEPMAPVSISPLTTPVTTTPEPASVALVATGLIGMGGVVRKRRQSSET